jgi:transcriptional regulator with PAS, ATPase and Fis domain
MDEFQWVREFPASIMVCDPQGILIEMNDRAALTLEKDGGRALLGKNILDCHPGPARSKTQKLLETREKSIYTVEKNGVKKLIFQSPWYRGAEFAGFVEISLEIPFEMPHFVRT